MLTSHGYPQSDTLIHRSDMQTVGFVFTCIHESESGSYDPYGLCVSLEERAPLQLKKSIDRAPRVFLNQYIT